MIITHEYPRAFGAYVGISHKGTLGPGYIQLSPNSWVQNDVIPFSSRESQNATPQSDAFSPQELDKASVK